MNYKPHKVTAFYDSNMIIKKTNLTKRFSIPSKRVCFTYYLFSSLTEHSLQLKILKTIISPQLTIQAEFKKPSRLNSTQKMLIHISNTCIVYCLLVIIFFACYKSSKEIFWSNRLTMTCTANALMLDRYLYKIYVDIQKTINNTSFKRWEKILKMKQLVPQ